MNNLQKLICHKTQPINQLTDQPDYCYILTFDPAQKYYSKVIHRKEVTHSNGQ